MIIDNLRRAAQGTLSEREIWNVALRLDFDRWEDESGQEAPMNAALTVSHPQTPSDQTQRLWESAALACLADDSANAHDTHADNGS